MPGSGVRLQMGIFVGGVALLAGLFIRSLIPVFLYSPWLNGFILMSFACGAWLPFAQVRRLSSDRKFFTQYNLGRTEFGQYRGVFTAFHLEALTDKKRALSGNEIQTLLSSLRRRLSERHSVCRYLVGVLVLLGLLGTFWGLTQTVSSIAATMKGLSISGMAAQDSFNQLRASIESPLSGMGVAFSSSILGLVSSLILGFLDLLQSKAERNFYNFVEEKLMMRNREAPASADPYNGVAYTLALLEQTAEAVDNLERSFAKTEDVRLASLTTTQKVAEALARCSAYLEENQKLFGELAGVNRRIESGLQSTARGVEAMAQSVHAAVCSPELQTLRVTCERILEEIATGQQTAVQELRKEIRMVVKTLSALAEPEDASEQSAATVAG